MAPFRMYSRVLRESKQQLQDALVEQKRLHGEMDRLREHHEALTRQVYEVAENVTKWRKKVFEDERNLKREIAKEVDLKPRAKSDGKRKFLAEE